MVGRRENSFRCWSIGKSDFLLPERGYRFAGLQIASMAYPPSSTVSYFNQIYFISNLNDWLIVDGVFFVIRCIILLSNKTEKMKQVVYLLFLSKRCSVERSLYRPRDSRHERNDDSKNAPWQKLYKLFRGGVREQSDQSSSKNNDCSYLWLVQQRCTLVRITSTTAWTMVKHLWTD